MARFNLRCLATHCMLVLCIAYTHQQCAGSFLPKRPREIDSSEQPYLTAFKPRKLEKVELETEKQEVPLSFEDIKVEQDDQAHQTEAIQMDLKQLPEASDSVNRRMTAFHPKDILHWKSKETIGNMSLEAYVYITPRLFGYKPDEGTISQLLHVLKKLPGLEGDPEKDAFQEEALIKNRIYQTAFFLVGKEIILRNKYGISLGSNLSRLTKPVISEFDDLQLENAMKNISLEEFLEIVPILLGVSINPIEKLKDLLSKHPPKSKPGQDDWLLKIIQKISASLSLMDIEFENHGLTNIKDPDRLVKAVIMELKYLKATESMINLSLDEYVIAAPTIFGLGDADLKILPKLRNYLQEDPLLGDPSTATWSQALMESAILFLVKEKIPGKKNPSKLTLPNQELLKRYYIMEIYNIINEGINESSLKINPFEHFLDFPDSQILYKV